jgi:hypothetical protein
MRGRFALLAALALSLVPAAAEVRDAASPTATARAFYGVYGTFHPSDGIPDAKARARYQPYLTPALDRLLADASAAETRFAAKNNDSPPLIEGDLFTSNFEGANSWTVRNCETAGATARCAVDLVFEPSDGKNKPVNWSDRLYLSRTAGGWRVDDIGYGATGAFGNKGRLSDTLKEAIRDAGS